ncbi:uncharacterized protein MELLADRAFT_111646 [Melampsora larici-populina 98AG31]|uniref:Uncharacterized protein n=1 Tax=Melampsora larici-populina (strain 98AG31 / pathotype 3-4-7) TaxID=747676 RepID=F4S3W0_MELLP|nr:uncharacterized protein MELLADRAFT_111646 [Melampsora larici-populina 98AG31]EGG00672.1 hypothetical protein MELLADRAFT_111646 [Melampsora larici-populina 98AG31]
MTPRYKPGAAAAANLKAANQAQTELAKKAAKASSRLSLSLLHPPSPTGSRSLCPRSPQSTRTNPGFVAQPRDSRLAVPSPFCQSTTSKDPIEILDTKLTSDDRDPEESSTEDSSDKGTDSSSVESTAEQSGGKPKKKKRKLSKRKKGKGWAKGKKKVFSKALVKMVENNSDIELISNPNPKKPGRSKQTAEETNKLFSYYGEPEWDKENLALLLPDLPKNHKPVPTIILNSGDDLIEDCDEDIDEPPSRKDGLEQCVGDDKSEVDGEEGNDADEIEATEISSGDSFSKSIHKASVPLPSTLSSSYTPSFSISHVTLLNNQPPATSPTPKVAEQSEPTTHNIFKEHNIFALQTDTKQPGDAKLQAYLSGKFMCDDNQDILEWWAQSARESCSVDRDPVLDLPLGIMHNWYEGVLHQHFRIQWDFVSPNREDKVKAKRRRSAMEILDQHAKRMLYEEGMGNVCEDVDDNSPDGEFEYEEDEELHAG